MSANELPKEAALLAGALVRLGAEAPELLEPGLREPVGDDGTE